MIIPLAVALAVLIAWKLGYFELEQRRRLLEVAEKARGHSWAAPLFVSAWAIIVSLGLPAVIMTMIGGALFGLWKGALLTWIGALGATGVAFLLSKYIARKPMERLFGNHLIMKKLRERGDVVMLFRLRLLPLAPFAVLDYVAGIAGVPFLRMLMATMVGIVPSVIAYSYVGHALMGQGAGAAAASNRAIWIALAASGGMLLLSIIPTLFGHPHEPGEP